MPSLNQALLLHWLVPSESENVVFYAAESSYYAPEPSKEKSHLPNTYYCTADDLAALIPPPAASSWHQASPYSLHQQAIPHKRKATDLADSTREKRHPFKLLPFLCWHQEKERKPGAFLSIHSFFIIIKEMLSLLNQQQRSKLPYPWRTAFQQSQTNRCWACR